MSTMKGMNIIMITNISHNALLVSDMEKSIDFYCNVVGLTKAFEIHDDEDKPWIVYLKICDVQFMELFYNGVHDHEKDYASDLIGYHHFCFEIDDLDEMGENLYQLGYINSPKTSPGKDMNSGFWINDPDGNAVEFVKYHPDSPHLKN